MTRCIDCGGAGRYVCADCLGAEAPCDADHDAARRVECEFCGGTGFCGSPDGIADLTARAVTAECERDVALGEVARMRAALAVTQRSLEAAHTGERITVVDEIERLQRELARVEVRRG